MRAFLGLCLVVILSLTSVTAAVARGQMAGAVDMVVCAGSGVSSVTLDATGKPVEVHHCPVCTVAGSAASVPVIVPFECPAVRGEVLWFGAGAVLRAVDASVPLARGPPGSV